MDPKRILYVSQEIRPYLPETEMSKSILDFAKKMNERGHEVRVFMPRYGLINERRHQLHEVIRLSGMNVVINDMDQPLIIKVASVPSARLQVYFIDNEDYFKRKSALYTEKHELHADNDERALFFAKSVLETVKKLGWVPDIIHISGWFCTAMPLYVKHFHADDPHFSETKVIFSAHNNKFEGSLGDNLAAGIKFDGAPELEHFEDPTFVNLNKAAVKYSDGLINAQPDVDPSIAKYAESINVPVFDGTHLLSDPAAVEKIYAAVAMEETIA